MKFSIIAGSQRSESQSARIAAYLEKELTRDSEVYLLDLGKNPLPVWDDSFWDNDPKWEPVWPHIQKELAESDGIIIITPEYHGMASPAIKNFFLYAGKNELGDKAGLIVAVSSGMGGSYPVSELRSSSYKNSRICYIPEHIIVRNAEDILNDKPSTRPEEDSYMRKRIPYTLNLFKKYAEALKTVRDAGLADYKNFGNGM